MNRLGLIKTAYTALAALMLAACANDELTDGPGAGLARRHIPLADSRREPDGRKHRQSRGTQMLRKHVCRKTRTTTAANGTAVKR